ncbi:MAG: nicotinate-nucleotide--dimethylbenzimidazole phosphoribosyltransferase [Azospirillaceae bacterium]
MPIDETSGNGAAPAISFAEILETVRHLPPPDLEAKTAAELALKRLGEGHAGGAAAVLGRLTPVVPWLAAWQGRSPAETRHPRLILFAGTHGLAARAGIPPAATRARVDIFSANRAPASAACQVADADLRLYELDLETPTDDAADGPAMSERMAAQAMAYGMMGVDQGLHLLALGTVSEGGRLSAAALACALAGGEAADWLPPGAPAAERQAVGAAVARHADAIASPLDALARLGGFEVAALIGAMIAARLARTPVLLDGFEAGVAALLLWAVDTRAIDHCLAAHVTDAGHRRLLDRIGREPLLDLGIAAGEGLGAAMAIPLVRAAANAADPV